MRVRLLTEYLTPDSDSGSERWFCGACNLDIGGVYGRNYCGWPGTPDDLMRRNERQPWERPFESHDGESLRYYAFCPWCGTRFDDEWWMNHAAENERVVDHYRAPGHHKGDEHVFTGGSMAEAAGGHYLGCTDPDMVCWCEPEVVPSLTGCEIRHKAGTRDR